MPALQVLPTPVFKKNKDGTESKKILVPGLRNIFIPRPDNYLVKADYSALELLLTAYFCEDLPLITAFEKGVDVHNQTARTLFPNAEIISKNLRRFAKVFTYAVIYRGSAMRVWRTMLLDFPNTLLNLIEIMIERWNAAHPAIIKKQNEWIKKAASKKYGYIECPLNGVKQYYYAGKINEQEIANFPNQSAGAHIIDKAIIKLDALINWKTEGILAQVHDELIVEGPDPIKLFKNLKDCMEQTYTIHGRRVTFPVEVNVGNSWACTKEFSTIKELETCLQKSITKKHENKTCRSCDFLKDYVCSVLQITHKKKKGKIKL